MDEVNDNQFGNRLKQIIMKRGITQQKFAKECELDDATLSNFIHGKHDPSLKTLEKMLGRMSADDIAYLFMPYAGRGN